MTRRGVLIVGAGFLGSAVATRLGNEDFPLHVLTRQTLSAGDLPATVHLGGLDNESTLHEILPRCDTVLHVASATTPSVSAGRPILELEANIAPTLRLIAALQQHRGIHVVYVSTGGALYDDLGGRAATEDDAVRPRSFHGAGKAAIESFLRAEAAQSGRALTILRPSNLYGPGQPLRSGFGVVRTMLEHARKGTVLELWGDGQTVRDFLYVDDMVEVCRRFVALPDDRGTYNVGSGSGHSLNEVRAIVERICGCPLRMAYGPARGVDMRHAVLDITRLQRRLSWKPAVMLEEGIRATWKWLRED